MDRFLIRVQGLSLSRGDRLAFNFNGVAIGNLAVGDGLALNDSLRARGQLGRPNIFHDTRIRYAARKRRLTVLARRGLANLDGAALVQEESGLSETVHVAVLVDRAPGDRVVDAVAVVPARFKVKRVVRESAGAVEQGHSVRPSR